ncbi:4-fold beta flower protein [Vibrio splendidus]|uniref:4-fold beta flower protein n=1 Tax=Vibrio splendidus TaxID=29497 RepID=UPI003CE46C43
MVFIFFHSGAPLGYISDDSIYSFSGAHIGYFNDGVLRDNRGNALLFTPKSSGGPIKPVRQMKPMKDMKPIRPIKTYGWSSYELDSIWGR